MGRRRGLSNRGHIHGRQGPSAFEKLMHNNQGEMNSDLAEKFKMRKTASSEEPAHSTALLNTDIRAYVHSAEQMKSHSNPDTAFLTEIPTSEEILNGTHPDNFNVYNNTAGPWKDTTTYLETHYKLLREDAVRPLREAILTFRDNPTMTDDQQVTVYEKVHIIGVTFAHLGLSVRVRFSTARAGKKINWEHSKRLIAGSMIALSPATDAFKSACIVAVVAARPFDGVNAIPPEVDLFFACPEDIEIDPQIEFTMLEARSGYFESTRHTMKALQKLSIERFPLASQIVGLDDTIGVPAYIDQAPEVDLSPIDPSMKTVDILNDWPAEPAGGLDASQWSALRRILTKELSIVQGPPGTGKTHVSVAALKILLANKSPDEPPIIVAAHTNHALDQLLRHVSGFERNYVRLGGRSTDEDIKRRTLYEVRKILNVPPVKGGLLLSAVAEHKALTSRMIKTLEPLITEGEGSRPFLNATIFENLGLLSAKQVESLDLGARQWTSGSSDEDQKDSLALWVEKSLIPFEVKYQDGNFGFEEDAESEMDQEFEQLKELEAEQGADLDDKDHLQGPFKEISDGWTVTRGTIASATAQKYLDNTNDLWSIPEAIRGSIYAMLQNKAKAIMLKIFREQAKNYARINQNRQIGRWEKDAIILRGVNVVGMTTTGLSKYRALVASVRPKVVLIEEAAEVLEAPIAVACLESLEHLILIGDHQQLQPGTSVSQLARPPYNLHVSMFERLVSNNLPFDTLLRQRRMDPEFRRLLVPIYRNLDDHASVMNRPVPTGCLYKSWLFSHNWPESVDSSFSKMNEREALMIAAFFTHLVLNGIPINAITVLVFYNAQRKLILRELRKNRRLLGAYLNVVTVDSYQGEENSIVLLSLVRSTTDTNKSIGFCGVPNRVCVALSRARLGFYIFGNGSQLFEASPLWREVITIMAGQKRIGYNLPLRCSKHGREIQVKDPEDFHQYNGGCSIKCPDKLECGHPCPHKCHHYKHSEIICPQKCKKTLICGHQCQGLCGDPKCHCLCESFGRVSVEEGPIPRAMSGNITISNRVTPFPTPWETRQKLVGDGPARKQRTPSPKKHILPAASQEKSPEHWRKYAAGGFVRDDEKRDHAVQLAAERPKNQNLMDADYEHEGAKLWMDHDQSSQHGSNAPIKPLKPAHGIISETRKKIDDGQGGYRMRYQQTYVSPPVLALPFEKSHGLDGAASSITSAEPVEDLIEL